MYFILPFFKLIKCCSFILKQIFLLWQNQLQSYSVCPPSWVWHFVRIRSNSLKPCLCRLKVAFKWLVRAFSGYLSSDQVLLLWDRILAYNSMEILAGKL